MPGDSNWSGDIFVTDVSGMTDGATPQTKRVSQGNSFSAHASISADGRYVTYDSDSTDLVPDDTNQATDVFVTDMANGNTDRVSVDSRAAQANGRSVTPSISGDGSQVAYESGATNLVASDTNAWDDIFVTKPAGR